MENKKTKENKIFFVGDVHGCFNELKALLKKAKLNLKKDRLVLLGDVINKGPFSFEILCWIKKSKHIQCLLGNHELKWLNLSKAKKPLPFSLQELEQKLGPRLKEYQVWLRSWPLFLEEKDFLAVHAGVVPGQNLSQSLPEHLVNIRSWDGEGKNLNNPTDPPWYEFYKEKKPVIYAHWAKQGLQIRHNTIGLDAGCVYGKRLCGIWWPSRKIVCVPAEKKYV